MSALNLETLWAIPVSIFIAGFIASPHCVAMCGPLVLGFAPTRPQLVSYQLGRLTSYTLAGTLAGLLGSRLLEALQSSRTGLFAVVAIFIALVLIGFQQMSGSHFQIPKWIPFRVSGLYSLIRKSRLPKTVLGFAAGAFSAGLPCAHLWGFVVGAAATGSALGGAIFMAAFWLGTLPALVAAPWALASLKKIFGKHAPLAAGLIMIVAGLLSLANFTHQIGQDPNSHEHHGHHGHSQQTEEAPAHSHEAHHHH